MVSKKTGGLAVRPPCNPRTGWSLIETTRSAGCRLDRDHRNNAMAAVDNDDLIIDDEVEKPTPFGMDFDSTGATSTTRTEVGTVVPTLTWKLTLLALGALLLCRPVSRTL